MASVDDRPMLQLAHSPDPDDVFMWWPLFERDGEPPRMDTGRFGYVPVREDIETLNQRSMRSELEITAMSCAQYPHVKDRYVITACGASMGSDYGPKLISRTPLSVDALREVKPMIAVPGERTSAFAALNLLLGPGNVRHEVVPFETIIDHVADGSFDAGVVIHEGQLTFEQAGLHLIEDLGRWWTRSEGLPMPLGVNAIRRDLEDTYGEGTLAEIATTLLASVEYALAHREESIAEAMAYARGMDQSLADEFVSMYVNRMTLDFGEDGRAAVARFLAKCHDAGLLPDPGEVDFLQPLTAK